MVRLVGTEVRSRSCRGEEPGPGTTSGEGLRGSQRRNLGCQLPHLADLLGSAPRTTEALWGLVRHPFPGTAKREHEGVSRGQVLPVVASLRAPPARPRLGKAAERDVGMSGKGRVGETSRPSARKELPLSGKDFDARTHPFTPPSPTPCTPASGGPSPVLWKALGEEAAA